MPSWDASPQLHLFDQMDKKDKKEFMHKRDNGMDLTINSL
jgi:hypothetical protein